MKKKEITKKSTSQLPAFRDLLPNLEGVGSLWISDQLVKMIVELVALAKTQISGEDQKTIVNSLDSQLGIGIMRPNLLKLVALMTQLSRWVKDGNNPAKLSEYVKARLVAAAYKSGLCGRQMLDWAVEDLKIDLQDCKTGYVFDRPRAA